MSRALTTWTPRARFLRRRLRREARWGLIVAMLFFGGLGGWAAAAPLGSAIVAPGAVVVSGSRQAVQHRDGGIVRRILVHDGQRVEAGDVLLELDGTEVDAHGQVLTTQYISLMAVKARLESERSGLADIVPPEEFAALSGTDRIAADEAMSVQRERMELRRGSLRNEADVLQRRVEQLRAQIGGFEAQIAAHDRQVALLNEELEGVRSLNERGLTPTTRVRELERGLAELEGRRAEYDASIARTHEEIGEAELQLLQLQRDRDEELAAELQDVELSLAQLQPQRSAALAQAERAKLRAPATGRIVGLRVHTETGVIGPGEVLMEIVPEDRPLVVQARVNPADIDALRPGARAQIRLTAFSLREAPILYGSLSQVSADSLLEEGTGAPYYIAEVRIEPDELHRIEAIHSGAAELRAGMPAEVIIPVRSRTALQYLVEPLTDRFRHSFRES